MTALSWLAIFYAVVTCGFVARDVKPPRSLPAGTAFVRALAWPIGVFFGALLEIAEAVERSAGGGRGGWS